MSVVNYLNFFATAYKLKKRTRVEAIDAVLELMDIQHLREVKIDTLSTGERQRLLFAKTFLHGPELWLLDEPLTPLDPAGQAEMVEFLGELQAMGKTVIVATNRLEDVLKLYNTDSRNENFVGILNGGRFAIFDRFSELPREAVETDTTKGLSSNWFNELLA